MKDFTKKGTKLPVIPVGTKFRTTFDKKSNRIINEFHSSTQREKLISHGQVKINNKIYIRCDEESYEGDNNFLIKLSTIERLAKEQGMYNTNNKTMKVTLQENGTVTVTDTETTTTLSKITVDEICRLVKDKDKQPIKPVITYGGWYQNKSNPKIVVFYEKDDAVFGGVGYGFDDCGGFTHANNLSLKSFKEDWQPATPETVEQYLRKEAVKRGYKIGTKIKSISSKNECICHDEIYYNGFEFNQLLFGMMACIFENGVWSEIIQPETITRAEAEKRYDVKITG